MPDFGFFSSLYFLLLRLFDRGAQVLAGGATTKSRRDPVITSLGMG
jgi:hypothetical protein